MINTLSKIFILKLILLGNFISNSASADATINITADQGKASLQVKDELVLIKSASVQTDALFDKRAQTLYIIDHAKKTVTPIDQQVMQQLSSQINSAMSALEKQLASMPPEQREQMEAFMGGMGISTKQNDKPAISLVSAGDTSYADIGCTSNKVLQGEQHIATVCISKGNNTKLSGADYNTLLSLQTFMLELARDAGQFAEKFGQQLPSFGDITLDSLVIHSESTTQQQTGNFKVESVDQSKIEGSLSAPADYRTEDITQLIK